MTIIKSIKEIKDLNSKKGKILSLDIGKKRIGVAICDETQTFCLPKEIIHRKNENQDFSKIHEILKDNYIKILVIGLPINMDESQSEISKFVENFTEKLDIYLSKKYPIFLQDERLTTFSAKEINNSQISKNAKYVDDISASLILENFLIEIS